MLTTTPSSLDSLRAWLAARPDPFDRQTAASTGKAGETVLGGLAEQTDPRNRTGSSYIPVERFRDTDPRIGFQGRDIAKCFRSSGTTSAQRSTALFSRRGLECYREAAIATFFAALRHATGADPLALRGISLIPPPSEWPDSSLAQMVAWLAELVPVHYAVADRPLPASDTPVWLFGTAFHHVGRIDSGLATRLPPGSVVIETGGTKGRTRSVSRAELYAMCKAAYGCPVVSEYGMCELASQAYDWGDGFRFPSWVDLAVVRGIGDTTAAGDGMLLIDDARRVDYPQPLRVEDLARLSGDGRFELLGRAPAAPLRGCSLNVSDLPAATEQSVGLSMTPLPPAAETKVVTVDVPAADALAQRAVSVEQSLRSLLADPAVLEALSREIGSTHAAHQAIADLLRSLPDSPHAWAVAARRAAGDRATLPRHWLFILPRNHSLVIAYPLAFARLLGLEVSVRLPPEIAAADGFASRCARQLDARLLAGADRLPPSDAVLCYGTDETVATIRATARRFVKGFGHHVTVAVADAASLVRDAAPLARDVLVTAQRGCLAPRLLIACRAPDNAMDDSATLAQSLLRAARAFWGGPAPQAARLGMEREAMRLDACGYTAFGGRADDTIFVAIKRLELAELRSEHVAIGCARHPFTIPVLLVKGSNADNFVKSTPSAPLAKSDYQFSLSRHLGAANAPVWNGFHLDAPLFAD